MALVRWEPFKDLLSIHDRMNKLFEGVRDKHSKGHHFRSEALREFTNKEKFRELVEFIKQILTESGKQQKFTVENLVEKFKSK